MTRMTSPMATASVKSTSWMDALTTSVVSKAMRYFIPGGKRWARRLQLGQGRAVHLQGVGVARAA